MDSSRRAHHTTRWLLVVLVLLTACPGREPATGDPRASPPLEAPTQPLSDSPVEAESRLTETGQEGSPAAPVLATLDGSGSGSGNGTGTAGTSLVFQLETDPPVVLGEAEGLLLESQRWRYLDRSGLVWRVRVPRDQAQVALRPADGVVPFASFLPDDDGPWAAVNGGFYDAEEAPLGLVVIGGVEIAPLRRGGGSGVFEWRDGQFEILHRRDWAPGADLALQSVDRLVDEGVSLVNSRDPRMAARVAIALDDDYLWLVVLADDRSIRSNPGEIWLRETSRRGVPLWIFAQYLVDFVGAERALNLDGGGSTQLHVRVGDETLRVLGERGTVNALVVRLQ